MKIEMYRTDNDIMIIVCENYGHKNYRVGKLEDGLFFLDKNFHYNILNIFKEKGTK